MIMFTASDSLKTKAIAALPGQSGARILEEMDIAYSEGLARDMAPLTSRAPLPRIEVARHAAYQANALVCVWLRDGDGLRCVACAGVEPLLIACYAPGVQRVELAENHRNLKVEEKRRLLDDAFGDWTKPHFTLFVRGCARRESVTGTRAKRARAARRATRAPGLDGR